MNALQKARAAKQKRIKQLTEAEAERKTAEENIDEKEENPLTASSVTPLTGKPAPHASPVAAPIIKRINNTELKRRAFARENGTVIKVEFLDSKKDMEAFVEETITAYSDIQREIARVSHRKNGFFIIRDEAGVLISSDNFQPQRWFLGKEITGFCGTHLPTLCPMVPIKWDFRKYHGANSTWVDPEELRRRELAALEEERLRKEEEEKAERARLEQEERQRAADAAAFIGDDDEWDDMINA